MIASILEPKLDLLREEYVLVQAWKKTASFIRAHNWYADTLELDRAAVDLPRFLSELAERLRSPEAWRGDPLRIVPAPKGQAWRVDPTGHWGPAKPKQTAGKLRPLAHVSLADQVVATALMLCLADRVETQQGDPRSSVSNGEIRGRVVSYGNRLFCDAAGDGNLRHRWGSRKLYRAYYQDYRNFLARPESVAEQVRGEAGRCVVIVQSDLRRFYDRVRPSLLRTKLAAIGKPEDDPAFHALAGRVLDWRWDPRDREDARRHARNAGFDFSAVALPQGLVAAGFFANVALLDLDQALRTCVGSEMAEGVRIEDACRYVDDLRIVLSTSKGKGLRAIETDVVGWLQGLLEVHAPGLEVSGDKTKAAAFRGEKHPLVRQGRAMTRIQNAVSGGFDAVEGEAILDAIQGLMRAQQRYSENRATDSGWSLSPVADVRDDTMARFAAYRFRTTYRSLRPLLAEFGYAVDVGKKDERSPSTARTQAELDDEARAFAYGLIDDWANDPSNVRLLRVGLDLWPGEKELREVLGLLRPYTEESGQRGAAHRVAWYCLSEVFRAGATETGFVEDGETLPAGIDTAVYREVLSAEAIRLVSLPPDRLPWYLKQQLLLFLAANHATRALDVPLGDDTETARYRELIRFLNGDDRDISDNDFAAWAVLARRSFQVSDVATHVARIGLTPGRLESIAERDPAFAAEILEKRPDLSAGLSPQAQSDLSLPRLTPEGFESLADSVLRPADEGFPRNEPAILRFASMFLNKWSAAAKVEAVPPADVLLKWRHKTNGEREIVEVSIATNAGASAGSLYRPPTWCSDDQRWRFHFGYLLRFILTARADFTRTVRAPSWREVKETYRTPVSHWFQRLYGMYSRHSAFGDDWLPISDWIEQLLSALLAWPGMRRSEADAWISDGIDAIRRRVDERIQQLSRMRGAASMTLILPVSLPPPIRPLKDRPMRVCVVQTVIPDPKKRDPRDFPEPGTGGDLTLSDRRIRTRHRNHLSKALAAVRSALDLRETHRPRDGRLDWLILPELSVHPRDVWTHLVPFARMYKAIILAGMTYQRPVAGGPLINSALWVIPTLSRAYGLQVFVLQQGKLHLAPDEEQYNTSGPILQGYRPCQWLVGYPWSANPAEEPLWLTASICYDATDLALAADLRDLSDVYAIPSLNRDVSTFDQMALALHYHMFQYVIVANNGTYGGSNAHVPYREAHERQVFHVHGQPLASIAFLEIDGIGEYLERKMDARRPVDEPRDERRRRWKYPPAGL